MTLIFVYNANSGVLNGLLDWTHKIISPETYACKLCALTYSNVGMRKDWREFIAQLQQPVEFLHRDELATTYGVDDVPLPAIFNKAGERLNIWLSANEMNRAETLSELQTLIITRLGKSTNQ